MRRPGPVVLFALASMALHLAWAALLPAGHTTPAAEPSWVEVAFEQVETTRTDTDTETPPAASPSEPSRSNAPDEPQSANTLAHAAEPQQANTRRTEPEAPVAHQNAVRRASATAPTPGSAEVVAPKLAPAETSARGPTLSDRSTPEGTATEPRRALGVQPGRAPGSREPNAAQDRDAEPSFELSARAAALSLEPAPSTPGLRCQASRYAPANDADCAPEDSGADVDGSAAQAALSRDLRGVAKSVPHLRPRDRPQLKARSDGSYAYQGHVFEAVVRPDGQVVFSDKAVEAQLRFSLTPFKVIADVNDIVEKEVLGRELYSAEKHWFLEQTRELRDSLASEHRRKEQQLARRALERALEEVVEDARLSRAQKHSAILALWQDCGEDAEAQAHGRLVEAFVRRRLPQGSELGFDSEEIERFNGDRAGLRPFAPYEGAPG